LVEGNGLEAKRGGGVGLKKVYDRNSLILQKQVGQARGIKGGGRWSIRQGFRKMMSAATGKGHESSPSPPQFIKGSLGGLRGTRWKRKDDLGREGRNLMFCAGNKQKRKRDNKVGERGQFRRWVKRGYSKGPGRGVKDLKGSFDERGGLENVRRGDPSES